MIVILGLGRETRAWLERADASIWHDGGPLVLDDTLEGHEELADGRSVEVRRVDLGDVSSVRSAVGAQGVQRIVRSPGVSIYRPGAEWLRGLGPCGTPTGLWLVDHAPRDLVAISGTKGKSTVAAMTAHLLRAAGRRVVLAGNIGVALNTVDPLVPRDDLVVELSSYQLADLELSAPAAAVGLSTLFVDHVPWHGSIARYHADKLRILDLGGWRVVGPQVATTRVAAGRFDAVAGQPTPAVRAALAQVDMHGDHEGEAAMLALALAARRTGTDATDLVAALATYEPLPHRLRVIARTGGLTYVDDSIATVPESTIAGLRTWRRLGPVTLLLGGDDRGQELAALVAALDDEGVRAALMPPMGGRLAEALRQAGGVGVGRVVEVADLAEGVAWAAANTPSGGAVLLSPAAPSFGAFRDFIHRSEVFAELVDAQDGAAR
jgi:UDP-N-acetylmuramoyl-L-alanine---L-glutamate ligase